MIGAVRFKVATGWRVPRSAAGELELQVVVSTARLAEVAEVLPGEQLRTPAEGQATLW
jgi:hypothetical protein